ncbi:MAG: hypothetical protein JWN41_1351, partial [Thermoleophilia bacterium]|nr:hypothetical protein [Thermoleophilia bacterium]
QRKGQRTTLAHEGDASARTARPLGQAPRNHFPWVPFIIVLALVVTGIAFAFAGGGESDDSSTKSTDETHAALPSITNSTTPPESSSQTVTLDGCSTDRPLNGTQPAVTPATGSPAAADTVGTTGNDAGAFQQTDVGTGDQVPSIGGANDPVSRPDGVNDTPSSSPEAVTVDQNGDICTDADIAAANSGNATSTSATDSTTTTGTAASTTSTTSSASGDWPAGKDGWTVIVAGYVGDEQKARQRAGELTQAGFDAGVLDSSDFSSLCPGIWVTFSGVFTTESQAESHKRELSAKSFQSTYAREIKRTGGSAEGCSN